MLELGAVSVKFTDSVAVPPGATFVGETDRVSVCENAEADNRRISAIAFIGAILYLIELRYQFEDRSVGGELRPLQYIDEVHACVVLVWWCPLRYKFPEALSRRYLRPHLTEQACNPRLIA